MKFIIIGAGQTGQLVAEITKRIPDLECVGFLDHDPARQGRSYMGVPVLGSDDRLEEFAGKIEGALPVVGDQTVRLRFFQRCRSLGFKIVSVIEPSAVAASDLRMGIGIFVSFNAAILTGVELGDYAFIGTGVNILHDTTIGRNCVIGGGTTIGASVTVGDNVSFGTGVTVASRRLHIGNNVRVAAGAVILKDVPDNALVMGNPARVIGRTPTIAIEGPVAQPPSESAFIDSAPTSSVFDDILGRTEGLSRPAILGSVSSSYGDLLSAVDKLSSALTQRGFRPSERVGICLDQGLEYAASLLAVRKVGGIAVLLGPNWTAQEKKRVMEHAEARWALADMPLLFDVDPRSCHPVDGLDCVLHEYDLEGSSDPEPGDAVIIYTSGTTGPPKGVVLTEQGVSANVRAVAQYLDMRSEDSAPIFTPACYAYSLSQNLVHLWAGAALYPVPSGLMFPAEVLQAVVEHSLTGLSGTPTAFRLLSQVEAAPGLELDSIRYVMSGGQPLDIRLVDQLTSLFRQSRVVNMYGCTENSPRISYQDVGQRAGMDEKGSFAVGRAVSGTRIRVETTPGVQAAADSIGEVSIGGTSLMRGYWRDQAATDERLVDGWFRTRDLGYLDEEGRLHLVGRQNTLINVGNEKVSPEEVEAVLMASEHVAKAAVYGIADPLLGESVQALVVVEPGAPIQAADLQRHCRGKISGYKIPRGIRFVDSIPETLYGKIDRQRLRELVS